MEPDEALLELERVDAALQEEDNFPTDEPCRTCPTHVTAVSGPDEVYLGQTYTFQVDGYSREVKGTYWQDKVSWEISVYREPERFMRPDRRVSVEKIVLTNHGETLELEIKEEWAFLDMQVFAYISAPVDAVSVQPKVRGAWAVLNRWTPQKIADYRDYASTTAEVEFRGNVNNYVCEDFAVSLVMQFARQQKLPFKITNGTGTYDAKEYHYSELDEADKHSPFDQVMLKTTGAPDLNPANQSNAVAVLAGPNITTYSAALVANQIKPGMIHVMDTGGDGPTNHIQVVTAVTPTMQPPFRSQPAMVSRPPRLGQFAVATVRIHQGNFPSSNSAAFGRGVGAFVTFSEEEDFYSHWYLGVPVQEGEYSLPDGDYTRNGSTSRGLLFNQVQVIAEWNFLAWNS